MSARRLSTPVLLGLIAAVALAASMTAFARYRAAVARVQDRREHLAQLVRDGDELLALRAQQDVAAAAARPTGDVFAALRQTLTESGIPTDRLRDLAQESDVPLSSTGPSTSAQPVGTAYRRQSLRFTLEPIATTQLGTFLAKWKQTHPIWTLAKIDLALTRAAARPGTPSSAQNREDVYTARLIIQATYVATN